LAFATRIAPNVGKKLLTAIPFVGTFAAIGFLLYEIYDEALNFFSEEEGSSPKVDAERENTDEVSAEFSTPVQAQSVERAPVAESVPPLVKKSAQPLPNTEKVDLNKDGPANQGVKEQSSFTSSPIQATVSDDQKDSSKEQIMDDASLDVPTFTMPKTLEFTESSEEIILEKKTVIPSIIINNIDNSSTFTSVEGPKSSSDTSYRYSTTVGT